MATTDLVADGTVVSIHYTLKDDGGDVLDSSDGGEPLAYLHGADNIVPGLERELTGKSVGDRVEVAVSPADGYGERTGESDRVPLEAFGDDAELAVGDQVFARDGDDNVLPLWVTDVGDDHVIVSPDHPLAGATLHFQAQVTAIRGATEDELEHGHPHGPDGHDHDH
jgi:FKBP-type peptidyl-prolyl cis-trans isomerase SlyD